MSCEVIAFAWLIFNKPNEIVERNAGLHYQAQTQFAEVYGYTDDICGVHELPRLPALEGNPEQKGAWR